jgi:hypothetical protein
VVSKEAVSNVCFVAFLMSDKPQHAGCSSPGAAFCDGVGITSFVGPSVIHLHGLRPGDRPSIDFRNCILCKLQGEQGHYSSAQNFMYSVFGIVGVACLVVD